MRARASSKRCKNVDVCACASHNALSLSLLSSLLQVSKNKQCTMIKCYLCAALTALAVPLLFDTLSEVEHEFQQTIIGFLTCIARTFFFAVCWLLLTKRHNSRKGFFSIKLLFIQCNVDVLSRSTCVCLMKLKDQVECFFKLIDNCVHTCADRQTDIQSLLNFTVKCKLSCIAHPLEGAGLTSPRPKFSSSSKRAFFGQN